MRILTRLGLLSFLTFLSIYCAAQDSLQEVYDLIKVEKYNEATQLSGKLAESGNIEAKILECKLIMNSGQSEKSAEVFQALYKSNPDILPYVYANFFKDYISGSRGNKKDFNINFLQELYKNQDTKGKLLANTKYWLGFHELLKVNNKASKKYFSEINHINNWSYVGPFDNVMNSGFNKDFQVLEHPEETFTFKGNYGQDIQWFTPPQDYNEGYLSVQSHFKGKPIIIFAQCFVNSPSEQEVLIDFPYSGSAKLWLNDQLIYSESAQRIMGYNGYHIKTKLNVLIWPVSTRISQVLIFKTGMI